ncbi:MAG: fibronectin type III domain-containing protein [bacterium]
MGRKRETLIILMIMALSLSVFSACSKKSKVTGTSDSTAPVITSISSGTPGSNSATITWTTDESATSQVEYGLSTSYGSSTTATSTLTTSHSVAISSLSASTVYHYRVKSKDADNNEATSGDNTCTTAADTGGPIISSVSVPSATLKNTAVTVTWTTDEAASTKIEWGISSGTYTNESEQDTTTRVTSHSITISSLTAGTLYYYRVSSKDSSNNETIDTERSFTTNSVSALTMYNFEAGTVSGWSNDTTAFFGDSFGVPSASTSEAHGGTYSLSFPLDMTALDPAWGCLNDAAKVTPTTTDLSSYSQLSIWMYFPASPAPTNPIQATVYIKTGDLWYWYESVSLQTITPGTWTEVTLDFFNAKHDDSTTNLTIQDLDNIKELGVHMGNGEGTSSTTFYIDDVTAQ